MYHCGDMILELTVSLAIIFLYYWITSYYNLQFVCLFVCVSVGVYVWTLNSSKPLEEYSQILQGLIRAPHCTSSRTIYSDRVAMGVFPQWVWFDDMEH